jgi:hypothetical protein
MQSISPETQFWEAHAFRPSNASKAVRTHFIYSCGSLLHAASKLPSLLRKIPMELIELSQDTGFLAALPDGEHK